MTESERPVTLPGRIAPRSAHRVGTAVRLRHVAPPLVCPQCPLVRRRELAERVRTASARAPRQVFGVPVEVALQTSGHLEGALTVGAPGREAGERVRVWVMRCSGG